MSPPTVLRFAPAAESYTINLGQEILYGIILCTHSVKSQYATVCTSRI